jgi:hypothetical protein
MELYLSEAACVWVMMYLHPTQQRSPSLRSPKYLRCLQNAVQSFGTFRVFIIAHVLACIDR